MYYRNNKKYIPRRNITMPLSHFKGIDERTKNTTLPMDYVADMTGFSVGDGVLKCDNGVSEMLASDGTSYREIQFPMENVYAFYLHGKRQLIASAHHMGYMLNEEKKRWEILPNIYFSGENSVLMTVGESPSIIIPKEDVGLYSFNGYDFRDMNVNFSPVSMASHMNRLFLVKKGDEYRLVFSGIDDPFNFDVSLNNGAGDIYLDVEDGKIVNLISYNGKLYIFREYAIYVLTGYADQREFSIRKVVNSSTKIKGDSIALSGDFFIYLDEEGLKSFDGYATHELLPNMMDTFSNIVGDVKSCYFNGDYFIKYNYNGINTLLRYSINSREMVKIEGINIVNFVLLRSGNSREELAIICDNMRKIGIIDSSGKFFDEDISLRWRTGMVDFGVYDKPKELVGFSVHHGDKFTLTIEDANGKIRSINVDGVKRYYTLNMVSYSYRFTITASGNIGTIYPPMIHVKL